MPNNILSYIIFISVMLSSGNICASTFQLRCIVTNIEEGTKIELSYTILKDNKWIDVTDSTKVSDGEFSFQGDIEEITAVRLDFPNRFIRIYIEPTLMRLYLDGSKPYGYQLDGTVAEKENIELRKQLQPHMKLYFELIDRVIYLLNKIDSIEGDTPMKDSLYHDINRIYKINKTNHNEIDKIYFDFSSKHSSFQIVPDLLYLISENESICIDSVYAIYNNLPDQNKKSMMGQLALKKIKEQEDKRRFLEKSSIGALSPNFRRKTSLGNWVELASCRNKTFVLLDFWASWCVPCLKEIPKIKKIHEKYKEKGLTIIGVSLDRVKGSWFEAIRKNGLNVWLQVLSSETNRKDDKNEFSESNLAYLYNCDAIPFYVLIDKKGKIVARWEQIGDAQLKKIDALLNSSENK